MVKCEAGKFGFTINQPPVIQLYFPNKTISQIEDHYQIALQEHKVPDKDYAPGDVVVFEQLMSVFGMVGLFSSVDPSGVVDFLHNS